MVNYMIIQYGTQSYKAVYYPYLYLFESFFTCDNVCRVIECTVGLYRNHNKKLFVERS